MAALDDLISQIPDESLRERIRAEMKRANRQKKFGLVFEEHLPEAALRYSGKAWFRRGQEGRTGYGHLLYRENRGWTGYLLPQGIQGTRRASRGCAGLRGPIW